MKILTGDLKGRAIHLAPNGNLRPTSDLARKAIFDTLQGAIEGKRVLDLFGGTGALGFEAFSSGAKEVVWVEMDRQQTEMIEKTLQDLGLEKRGRVIRSDAMKAVEGMGRRGEVFDLIFLDPPYHQGLGQATVQWISRAGIFSPEAILVLETHKTEDPKEVLGKFKAVKTKKHGDTKITFYRPA